MAGLMEGVRVVDLGVWIAGPAAAGILADWGADVVKIEPPGLGDPCRIFKKMLGADLPFNPIFEMDNRSKRDIVLDLASEGGCQIALELIDRADVVISNLRMSALERLGLDPETLLARNPRLIYGAVSGYGMEGPDKDRAAYDVGAYWSRAGLASMLTPADGQPPMQRGGMGDHTAGMSLAGGISAALFHREKTGMGQLVSTSLVRQGVYTLSFDLSLVTRFGVTPGFGDRKTMPNPAINSYHDSEDKWFWLLGLEGERHWEPLCRAIERSEWLEDARFATVEARAQNAEELIALLDEIFAGKTREYWAKIFDAIDDMWWAPVQTLEEVVADPQMHAAGAFVEVPDGPTTTTFPATPVDFGSTPWKPRWMAPEPGQHTDEILGELGRSPEQIAELRSAGAVG